jgi:hypothetical protein
VIVERMTVARVIEELRKHPEDAEVYVDLEYTWSPAYEVTTEAWHDKTVVIIK